MNILFALSSLHCGGIEKSALTLLAKLMERGDNVTLALAHKEGEFLPYVPTGIKIIEIPYNAWTRDEMRVGRKKLLIKLALKFRWVRMLKLLAFGRRIAALNADQRAIAIAEHFCNSLPNDKTVYDQALCFSEFTELIYVADHVNAKYKAVWLHTEQGNGFSDVREYCKYLAKMDDIYCVSDALVETVKSLLPEFRDKIKRYHHIIDKDLIRRMSNQDAADWPAENGAVRILSVGRLAYQKGFDLIPNVIRGLNKKGIRVSWMILGEGSERTSLEKLSADLGVSEQFVLPGVKVNPYPYYKACDIYVQPSRYEGYCLTLAEARVFNKPVVATDFYGAREQLKDETIERIVQCVPDEISLGVLRLIKNVISNS